MFSPSVSASWRCQTLPGTQDRPLAVARVRAGLHWLGHWTLWTHVIPPFSCPEILHSDQCPRFESKLIKELCQVYGCRKSHTTPYHPQCNGACERFNQTLVNLLGTLEVEQHSNWVGCLPGIVQSYNTIHSSTSYEPAFLMFGRHLRTSIEIVRQQLTYTKQPRKTK